VPTQGIEKKKPASVSRSISEASRSHEIGGKQYKRKRKKNGRVNRKRNKKKHKENEENMDGLHI